MLLAGLSIRGIRRWSRGRRRRRRISTTVVAAALDDLVRFGPRRGRLVLLRPRIALAAAIGLVRGLLGLGVHRRGRPLPFRAATVAAVRVDEGGVEGGFVHLDPPRRPLRPSCLRRGTRDDIARHGGRYCRRDDDDDDANERLPVAAPTSWRSSSSSTSDDLLDHDDDVIFRHDPTSFFCLPK